MKEKLTHFSEMFRLKNKYVITSAIFIIWIVFFDMNSLIERRKLIKTLKATINEKEFYKIRIKADSRRLEELRTNIDNLEKFAREEYLMKKDNEDIFIIVEE